VNVLLLLLSRNGDRGGELGGEGVLDIGLGQFTSSKQGDDGAVLLASTASDQGLKLS
jgi:hypothetical protein